MLIRTNSVISGNMVGILSEYVVLNKVEDSDEKYKCKEMSACPYTGTTIINKIPWGDWPAWVWSPQEADQEGGGMMEVRYDVVRDTQEEDQAEESDTNREEESGTAGSTARAPQDSKSNTARKPGLLNKIKRLFRK